MSNLRRELQLSFECLRLEQAACKRAEAAERDARRGLRLARAEAQVLSVRVTQLEEALQRIRSQAREFQRMVREALRAELGEQSRLRGRLAAAQDRIRELEALYQPAPALQAPARVVPSLRVWVDGWAACCSLS
ncbi:MAG: hypothetical protein AB1758_21105 [Candidatus Eremiobacterota bacterium]